MNIPIQAAAPGKVIYPDSDGQPMADNTRQFRWIVTLQGNLDAIFRSDPNVFVAGDLLWYPVEGDNRTRMAPDAMVVFGRPKGDRGSYQQWREDNIPPQVVFEVLSPGNRAAELVRKFRFYEQYGVEEYYIYDPDRHLLDGWIRRDDLLEEIADMNGWVSPRLGIRFELAEDDLRIYAPDGGPFLTYAELFEQSDRERERAEQERKRAEQERERADRLAAQLKALGVQPEP
jgi:Uma2 family endonuclease